MNKLLILISLFFLAGPAQSQDYFTGKLTDEKGSSTGINYDRTQLIVSATVHQTLYKVFDQEKKSLYTIFLTHDKEKSNIGISVSKQGSDTKGMSIDYDKLKCGLIFSNLGNTDTIFLSSENFNYLISFTDTGRDYPVLHKLRIDGQNELELDPLTKLRVRKHNELVKKFYPQTLQAVLKPNTAVEKQAATVASIEKTEQLVKESSVTYPLINDPFNSQLFVLRDSLYSKNSQFIELVTKMRNEIEYDIAMYMKDAHVYSDEERYGGEERNGQPQGKGILVSNGNIYDGVFVNGIFSTGKAVIKTKTTVYYGGSIKDSMSGIGWLKSNNGGFLLGEFKAGKLVDGITLTKENGEVFFGNYKNLQKTGYGELRNNRGDSYYGEFLNGRLIKGYSKEVDQFGYSTYSRIQNGGKSTVPPQVAEAFFDTVHIIKEKAESNNP